MATPNGKINFQTTFLGFHAAFEEYIHLRTVPMVSEPSDTCKPNLATRQASSSRWIDTPPLADRFKQQLIGGYNGGLSWCCGSLRSSWLSWKLELHLEDDLPVSISHVVGSISNFQGVII